MLQFTECVVSNVIPLRKLKTNVIYGRDSTHANNYLANGPISDWERANLTGRYLATDQLNVMISSRDTIYFVSLVREMIRKGEFGGLEAGFLQQFAEHIVMGSVNTKSRAFRSEDLG